MARGPRRASGALSCLNRYSTPGPGLTSPFPVQLRTLLEACPMLTAKSGAEFSASCLDHQGGRYILTFGCAQMVAGLATLARPVQVGS